MEAVWSLLCGIEFYELVGLNVWCHLPSIPYLANVNREGLDVTVCINMQADLSCFWSLPVSKGFGKTT